MDNIGNFSLTGPEVDLTNVVALNHRRSVTFMNNFLMNTSNFLNDFAVVSEENLAKQDAEMHKLEIALNILETKLSSIPGLENITTAKSTNNVPEEAKPPNANADLPVNPELSSASLENKSENQTTESETNVLKVKDDPRYNKYLKMCMVGVPKAAIEGKMRLEGLDPNLLDSPDSPVPDPPSMSSDDDIADSSSSNDSFSE